MEQRGRDAARPYVEAAAPDYLTVADEHGQLSQRLGFKVVPNGLLLDAESRILWAKYGGFSVANASDLAVVDQFLRGEAPGPSPELALPYTLDPVERDLVETRIRLGRALAELGRQAEAVAEWRAALRRDPENLTIRKQIWATEHPEKFDPEIDWDWQKATLAAEREREIAEGICGPDGCPLPWS